jgi:hypothetical protein
MQNGLASGRFGPAGVPAFAAWDGSSSLMCYGILMMVLRTAVRARLIAVNPAEGVKVPGAHKRRAQIATITREQFFGKLLPAVPAEYRAIVCMAVGAGLRWANVRASPGAPSTWSGRSSAWSRSRWRRRPA